MCVKTVIYMYSEGTVRKVRRDPGQYGMWKPTEFGEREERGRRK